MKKAIKLVALDLDGTLLDSNKAMPEDFLPWVRKHSNVKTVIASGRQYYTILRDFPIGQDKLTIIAENGGLVYDNNEMIYINSMNAQDIKESLKKIEKIPGATPILCGVESAYIPDVSDEIFGMSGVYYDHIKRVPDLYEYIEKDRFLKIAIFFANRKAQEHISELQDIPENVTAILSGERWIDVANCDVNKGTAIKKILELFGIDRAEAAAFGDYLNDYEMLKVCEESYCMENGHPDLKQIAKYITSSNDDNGVMKVLNSDAFITF